MRSKTLRRRRGLCIEAAAVVSDADNDVAALVIRRKTDRAAKNCPPLRARPVFPGHDRQNFTMGATSGSSMRSRNLTVEFGVGAMHLEFDLLAEFAREGSGTMR